MLLQQCMTKLGLSSHECCEIDMPTSTVESRVGCFTCGRDTQLYVGLTTPKVLLCFLVNVKCWRCMHESCPKSLIFLLQVWNVNKYSGVVGRIQHPGVHIGLAPAASSSSMTHLLHS